MATWKIEPTWKKSIIERMYFTKDDKQIMVETGWRWGEFLCETEGDEPPLIEAGIDLFNCDYEIEMQYCDDGCWTDYEFDGFDENEEEEMREWLDENSFFDLTEDGWVESGNEMIMDCDPEITKVEEK